MHRKRFWVVGLLALTAVVVLASATASVLRLVRWQGYGMRGWVGPAKEEPLPGRAWRSPLAFSPFLCGLGALLRVGLMVLPVAVLVRVFHQRTWGRGRAPMGGPWHGHPHWHHAPHQGAESRESYSAKVSPDQPSEGPPDDEG
jgi:hypothetical protein